MTTVDEWAAAVAAGLGIDPPTAEDLTLVLDVAREVAHNVLRPGAPVTAYLLGVAVGRGMALDEVAGSVIDRARDTARDTASPPG